MSEAAANALVEYYLLFFRAGGVVTLSEWQELPEDHVAPLVAAREKLTGRKILLAETRKADYDDATLEERVRAVLNASL